MTRYYLATYNPEHGIEYEPWSVKPSAFPSDEPWALYSRDFYILKRSHDWNATIDREYEGKSRAPTGTPIPKTF